MSCSAGTQSNATGLTTCWACTCSPGQRCQGFSATCSSCPAGFSCQGSIASSCAPGYYALGGASTCTKATCANGTFSVASTGACSSCPAGTYCTGSVSVPCPLGTYSDVSGASVCTLCSAPAGRSCSPAASPAAWPVCSTTATEPLTYCPGGPEDPVLCQCPAGTYCSGTLVSGREACSPCPAGSYCRGDATAPAPCTTVTTPPGRACLGNETSAAASPCPVGHWCPGGSTPPQGCFSCAPGTYCPSGLAFQQCLPCSVGRYCAPALQSPDDLAPLALPADCTPATTAPGYACMLGGADPSGTVCTQGFICAGAAAAPAACPPGSSSSAGATACAWCAAGSYNPYAAQGSCSLCPPGRYGLSPGAALAGELSCTACPPGRYNPSPGVAAACLTCPVGSYSSAPASLQCTPCPLGTYSTGSWDGGSTSPETCTACPPGTIGLATGQHTCTVCGPGTYQPLRGANSTSDCRACAPGTYSSVSGQTEAGVCTPCPTGTYSVTEQSWSCTPCPAGTYQSVSGASSLALCTTCPPGSYCGAASSDPTACPAGTYGTVSGLTARAECSACPAGTYCSATGSTAPEPCPAGHYCGAGSSDPTACPVGRYGPRIGESTVAGACSACTPGRFASLAGQAACDPCPVGTYSVAAAAAGPWTCTGCSAGSFSDTEGSSGCTSCPPGTYGVLVRAWGNDTCVSCPQGRYASGTGETTCAACRLGFYGTSTDEVAVRSSVSVACTSCPAGRYGNLVSSLTGTDLASVCTVCGLGMYSTAVGAAESSTCQPCPAGAWSNVTAATTCHGCRAGTVGAASGQVSVAACVPCPAGYYTDSERSTQCTACPSGTYNSVTGQTALASCLPCPPHYVCEVGSATPVYNEQGSGTGLPDCLPGRYLTTATSEGGAGNVTRCADCPPSCYCPNATLPAPLPCPPGSYCIARSTAPAPCPAGSIRILSGGADLSDCTLVDVGHFSNAAGSTSASACPLGHFSSTEGATTCSLCPAGTVSGFASGQSVCESCSPGRFFATAGGSECSACPIGSFSFLVSATACVACSPGTFSHAEGQTECTPCSGGHFAPWGGASACTACSAGRYCNATRCTACPLCDIGTRAPSNGSTFCTPCSGDTLEASEARCGLGASRALSIQSEWTQAQFQQAAASGGTYAYAETASSDPLVDIRRERTGAGAYAPITALWTTVLTIVLLSSAVFFVVRRIPSVKSTLRIFDGLDTDHWIAEGEVVRRKPRALGGFFTLMAALVILCIMGMTLMDYVYTVTFTKTVEPASGQYQPVGRIHVALRLFGSPVCAAMRPQNDSFVEEGWSIEAIEGVRLLSPGSRVHVAFLGDAEADACRLEWTCEPLCAMATSSLTVRLSSSVVGMYASGGEYTVETPGYLSSGGAGSVAGSVGSGAADETAAETFALRGSLLPDGAMWHVLAPSEVPSVVDVIVTPVVIATAQEGVWVGSRADIGSVQTSPAVDAASFATEISGVFEVRFRLRPNTLQYEIRESKTSLFVILGAIGGYLTGVWAICKFGMRGVEATGQWIMSTSARICGCCGPWCRHPRCQRCAGACRKRKSTTHSGADRFSLGATRPLSATDTTAGTGTTSDMTKGDVVLTEVAASSPSVPV
jgi:hypothetical protein